MWQLEAMRLPLGHCSYSGRVKYMNLQSSSNVLVTKPYVNKQINYNKLTGNHDN